MNARTRIKVKVVLLLMVSFLFLQVCAPSRISLIKKMEITAVPSIEQKIGYLETITSQKKHFVSLAPYSEINVGNKIAFMISIQNCGEVPLDISLDNISVTFEDNTKNGGTNEINVQSLHDFMNDFKMESRINEFIFLYGILENSRVRLKEIMGEVVRGQSSDTYSNIYFDIQDIAYSLSEKRAELETMHEQNQQILDMMPNFVMSRQIIMPGDSYAGVMVCDTHQMNPTIEGNFQLTVSIDGEEHKFTFRRAISK